MATAGELPDFGEHTPPTAVKVTGIASGVIVLLFVHLAVIWSVVIDLVLALIISRPIRAGHGFWFQLVAFVVALAMLETAGFGYRAWALQRTWFASLAYGRPRFRPLGGPGSATFRFILGCSKFLRLDLTDEADEVLRMIGRKDLLETEAMMRRAYVRDGHDPATWSQVWERMKRAGHLDQTFGGVIEQGRWNIFAGRATTVERMVLPLTTIYTVGTLWLLAGFATSDDPLPLLQFTLVAGFVIALVIFVNFTVSFRSLTTFEVTPLQSQWEIQEALSRQGISQEELADYIEEHEPGLRARIEQHLGRTFYPEIGIEPGYIEQVRNRFSRMFFVIGMSNIVVSCLFLMLQWPVARLVSGWPDDKVDSWTTSMLLYAPLIPVALLVAMALGFMVVSRLRKLVGLLTTAVLLAAIPPVITYALGLDEVSDQAVLISSIVSAVIGVIPTAIAELVKEKPSLPKVA